MPIVHWTPNPALAAATRDALQRFAMHWPRAMLLARDSSEAGAMFLNDYAFALSGVSLNAIPVAVMRWVADKAFAPSAKEFADYARTVAREMRGSTADGRHVEPIPQREHAPAVNPTRRQDLVTATYREASRQLAEYAQTNRLSMAVLVGEMYALLYHTAQTSEQRRAVSDGTIPNDVLDDAIDLIKRGVRAPHGPMKSNLTAKLTK